MNKSMKAEDVGVSSLKGEFGAVVRGLDMKWRHALSAAAAILLCLSSGADAATSFTLSADASQAGSPSTGTATGTATLSQDANGNHLSFEILIDSTYDLTALGGGGAGGAETFQAMHFHDGFAGQTGFIVFGMEMPNHDLDDDLSITPFAGGTRVTGEWDSGEGGGGADLDDFVAGMLAANPGQEVELFLVIHTVELMPGSIRGQLIADGSSVPALGAVAQVVLIAGFLWLSQAAGNGRR